MNLKKKKFLDRRIKGKTERKTVLYILIQEEKSICYMNDIFNFRCSSHATYSLIDLNSGSAGC